MLTTHLVPAADKDSRHLMVVLHGLGDSMDGYRWLPPALQLPWLNYLLVNAPDEYYGGYAWFDLYHNSGAGIARSRQLLFDLLADLEKKGFPAEKTWVFGFSQGCLLTLEVGFRYPKKLAGLVAISGWPFEPEKLLAEQSPVEKQQKFLVTHGPYDPLIPMNEVKGKIREFQQAGLDMQWKEFPKDHTIDMDQEVGVIRDFVIATGPKA